MQALFLEPDVGRLDAAGKGSSPGFLDLIDWRLAGVEGQTHFKFSGLDFSPILPSGYVFDLDTTNKQISLFAGDSGATLKMRYALY